MNTTETIASELHEFMQFPVAIAANEDRESYRWTYNDSLIFLDLYKVYRKQVGTLKLKSLKKMFEELAKEMTKKTGKHITATNCENRWRVLERAYKKYIADTKKTGAARREFEYADIMHEILGDKKNIHPVILLSSTTLAPVSNVADIEDSGQKESEIFSKEEGAEGVLLRKVRHEDTVLDTGANNPPNPQKKVKPLGEKKTYHRKTLKSELLKEMRIDRQHYYAQRLQQEDRKLEEKVKKNKLLEEKNTILKEIVNQMQPLDNILINE